MFPLNHDFQEKNTNKSVVKVFASETIVSVRAKLSFSFFFKVQITPVKYGQLSF